MKKLIFTLIIAALGFTVQAQKSTLAKFDQLCKDCNTGKADYPRVGCRVLDGICESIQSDKNIGIQKEDKKIKRVSFAYEHDGEKMYGITAKIQLVNKKGKVVKTISTGDIYVLSAQGNISRVFGTQTTNFMSRQLTKDEAALFSFNVDADYKKRDKLKVKVIISTMEKTTRKLKVIKEFEQRVK